MNVAGREAHAGSPAISGRLADAASAIVTCGTKSNAPP